VTGTAGGVSFSGVIRLGDMALVADWRSVES
jgi:hypothetical protein